MELLLPKEKSKRAMRIKCRFQIDAGHSERMLEKMKYKVAEAFVEDVEKQGWKYDPNKLPPTERGFRMTGPYPATIVRGAPSKAERFHFNAERDTAAVRAGERFLPKAMNYVSMVPDITETDRWEYELSAVFIHDEILVET